MTGSPLSFSASVVILRVHKVGSLNDNPTRMGDRKKQTHKDGRRGSLRDSDSFLFQVLPRRDSAQRGQSVRRVRRQRDGGFPRAILQGSVPQDGLLRYVHFYLYRGPEAVACLVRLGAHKVSTRPPRGRCSLSCILSSSTTGRRLVAFK